MTMFTHNYHCVEPKQKHEAVRNTSRGAATTTTTTTHNNNHDNNSNNDINDNHNNNYTSRAQLPIEFRSFQTLDFTFRTPNYYSILKYSIV